MRNSTYTKDQLNRAERLAWMISSIPEDKKAMVVVAMNAYADGLAARAEINEAFETNKCKKA